MNLHRATLGLMMFCATAGAALADTSDVDDFFFDVSFGNLKDELAEARAEGKRGVFVFFEMDECPFCHRMRRDVLNQRRVQEYFRDHFFNITIDIEGDIELVDFDGRETTQKEFAFRQHRVRATPVLMFFDLEGRPVARYTGATAGVDEFLALGEYVVSGAYADMPFVRYKRMKRKNAMQ